MCNLGRKLHKRLVRLAELRERNKLLEQFFADIEPKIRRLAELYPPLPTPPQEAE